MSALARSQVTPPWYQFPSTFSTFLCVMCGTARGRRAIAFVLGNSVLYLRVRASARIATLLVVITSLQTFIIASIYTFTSWVYAAGGVSHLFSRYLEYSLFPACSLYCLCDVSGRRFLELLRVRCGVPDPHPNYIDTS